MPYILHMLRFSFNNYFISYALSVILIFQFPATC